MKQRVYETNAEYIESMMKQFKLVDMREQYRDLILEAESSAMDYESFLVRLLSVEEEGKRNRRTDRSQNLADLILSMPARMSLLLALQELGKV